MNSIFIAAHARSGSTFLCRLMEKIKEVRVYLEIFHYHYDIIDYHLQGDLSVISEKMSLPADKKKARSELVFRYLEFVGLLEQINPGKVIAFKVFPKHLPDKVLADFVRENRFIVLLRRNLLHSYISDVISVKIQEWGTVDTSQEKIEFSPTDFAAHVRGVMNYYRKINLLSEKSRQKLVTLDYETLTTSIDPVQLISSMLSDCLGFGVETNTGTVEISRQDKRTRASDKVLNVGEMTDYLERFGLSILDDGLVNCTDTDYARIETGKPVKRWYKIFSMKT